ncbi:5-formyltetrahydrofolate cyclo-ligase [Blattabacterium cuenoti]|uniref:5-formyltetrahydrofolate cyclo-ligase n=1 Tax=Blattabacterium cuenoti TaxID=1653831 RepID=UPI00163CD017|nr:5-formyltetrahydrofolate cyclo-ligase [Blattabacterium cuenoti]
MENDKIKLRKKYLFYRKKLSKIEVIKMSHDIFHLSKKLSFWNKNFYHIFLPIKKYNEINTFIITDFLLKERKKITIPCSDFIKNSIENCLFHEKSFLKKNRYGILEPVDKYIIHPSLIEVIFIPLLIFDLKGYRIGYGKGFYDKFITKCNKNVIKIGLSFFPPIEKIGSIHKNDLIIDIGITINKIFFFSKKKIL